MFAAYGSQPRQSAEPTPSARNGKRCGMPSAWPTAMARELDERGMPDELDEATELHSHQK